MLNPVAKWRHLVVALTVIATPVLVAVGLVGGGRYPERFDAKQVVVWPVGGDAVRVREVVDQDFGSNKRHGYQRLIPTDGGTPTDIVASSPDAPDDLDVTNYGYEVRVRLGDPGKTIDGQHRYILEYTLPEVQLSAGVLKLDIIGQGETFETGRFEVVLVGFELTDTACHVGPYGTVGGCTLTETAGEYRVVFEPLAPGDAITVEGRIQSFTPLTDPAVAIPALPQRRERAPLPLAAGTAALGTAAAVGAFLYARRRGRNEVAGSGAADAAYAGKGTGTFQVGETRKVSDADLAEMATIEFAPPEGLHPWEGAMLLRERVDADTVGAWFSEQIAHDRLALDTGKKPTLRAGEQLAKAPDKDRVLIETMLAGGDLKLGSYQPKMATLWRVLTVQQKKAAERSGWWSSDSAGEKAKYPPWVTGLAMMLGGLVGVAIWFGFWKDQRVALAGALVIPAVVAGLLYMPMLYTRSATGSAMALRVESFRRFLAASEGNHVQWAWQRGVLRDYSAWAVALDAADTWGAAVQASGIPREEIAVATRPLMVHSYARSFSSAHTAPSSSSGGGFSGGSSGGGFGGGSSGSW